MTITSAIVGTGAIAHAHADAVRISATPAGDAPRSSESSTSIRLVPGSSPSGSRCPRPTGASASCSSRRGPTTCTSAPRPDRTCRWPSRCCAAGAIPIIEKPPALSLAELDRLHAVELETGIGAIGLFQQRFGAGAEALRSALAEGLLGRPLVAVCETLWYRDEDYFAVPWRGKWDVEGGGPTMGHGIHQMDLLLSVLGPWSTVRAIAARQARTTQTEDVSAALVTFENGAVATILNSLVSPREVSRLRFDFEYATAELEHLYGYDATDWRFTPAPGSEALADTWDRAGHRHPERSRRAVRGHRRGARGRHAGTRHDHRRPPDPVARGRALRVGLHRHHDRGGRHRPGASVLRQHGGHGRTLGGRSPRLQPRRSARREAAR